jgi:hypothetical protein
LFRGRPLPGEKVEKTDEVNIAAKSAGEIRNSFRKGLGGNTCSVMAKHTVMFTPSPTRAFIST